MTRTLQPGDQLSRYRIVGPLGVGGMGEVYRARDQNLERDVALKVLPPQLVRSEERVRRFVLEAKSASSLNHPNIVTIYEIGEETASSDGAVRPSGPVHFISMELVSGETLGQKIHEEKTDLRTLLGWLAQAADGISKAHAAGIVHRDLKPGNIMISSDGYAKVLDFGLAKLTEKNLSDALETSAPTEVQDRTAEGVIMGTAGYMSPEQVVGKTVDHRTDIFAFGCILYEATTRRRPFVAETSVETMHRILNDSPPPIEELNPRAPAELRRLIRRCLAKNPDQRLQSMKDLAIELREIVDEFDALSASATSATGSGSLAPISAGRRFPLVPVLAGAAAVTLVGVSVGLWGLRGGHGRTSSASAVQTTIVTNRGDVQNPALSPDGRYLAYISGPFGAQRLWVRQIATGSDVEVLPSQTITPFGFVFSPDGNYLFYLFPDPDHNGYKALYQVASLGGTPTKRAYDIDSPVAFSPDGRQICFMRGVPAEKASRLIVLDLESGQERILAEARDPLTFPAQAPAWSPDGKTIASYEQMVSGEGGARLVLYRASDGRREKIEGDPWPQVDSMVWSRDSQSLFLSASQFSGNPKFGIVRIFPRDGRVQPVTSGFDPYTSVTITSDGATLAALRNSVLANIWAVDVASTPPTVRQLTFSSNSENSIENPRPAVDGGLIYFMAPSNGRMAVWSIQEDGSNARPLTTGPGLDFNEAAVRGGAVFMRADETLVPHIWKVDRDGGNQKALTTGGGENLIETSPDGDWILYVASDRPRELLIMPSAGGPSRPLVTDFEGRARFSPDGRMVCYSTVRELAGVLQFTAEVVRVADSKPVPMRRLPPAVAGEIAWSASGPSLLYLNRLDPAWNVYRQELNDSEPRQITHFTEGRVLGISASSQGDAILLARQLGAAMNAWLVKIESPEPVQVTQFPTGSLLGGNWTHDGRKAVVAYGSTSRDAVLIRGF